jgi:enamine deaminase RidA (YjgF/YER057c/UK114 family)
MHATPAPGGCETRSANLKPIDTSPKERRMSKIIRTEPNKLLSKAVEYHGFVFLQGCTASDLSKDITGQTAEVLAAIDEILETHGTDKTRLLQAQS